MLQNLQWHAKKLMSFQVSNINSKVNLYLNCSHLNKLELKIFIVTTWQYLADNMTTQSALKNTQSDLILFQYQRALDMQILFIA